MEIKNVWIFLITILSFVFLIFLDFIDITNMFNYSAHIDNTISNLITFISILIGFISTIYVMIQQSQEESYVYKLLSKNNLIIKFNYSFKNFIFFGILDVLLLILLNFFADSFLIFKYIAYITLPLTTYFILISNNLLFTICKMIISEEKLKNQSYVLKDSDLKI